MKIALFGKGKMGKEVEALALQQGHQIVPFSDCDVCIDFSHASVVLEHVREAVALQKNLVMGTTGWEGVQEEVFALVKEGGIGFLHAPNFSTGVSLFFQIVREAARLIAPFGEYEAACSEVHHGAKKDSPSGTLKALMELFPDQELPHSALRFGTNPGLHTLQFDSPYDTITLSHQAKGRQGFAQGAIRAAEWLQGKKGIYRV